MPNSATHPPPRRAYRLGKRLDSIGRTRQRVIDAAIALYSRPGPSRISLDDVAAHAGVSRATLYYQFKSRPELLEVVFHEAAKNAGMGKMLAARELPESRAALEAYLRMSAEFWEASGTLFANIGALAAIDADARLLAISYDEQRRKGLAILADRLYVDGHVRAGLTALYVADCLWWMTSNVSFDHLRRRSGMSVADVGATLVHLVEPLLAEPLL